MYQMTQLDADVIVVGGGSAGTAAAVAAGRAGASVILIETGNCLGGTSTAGLVATWYASMDGLGCVYDDFVEMLDRFGAREETARSTTAGCSMRKQVSSSGSCWQRGSASG